MERVWCGLDVVHSVFDMVSPTLVLHSYCPNKPNKQGRKKRRSLSLVLHHSLLTLKLLLPFFLPCFVWFGLDRKSEGQVWDSPCQTHCAPHPIHTTLFPSNHTPLFNGHMVDWFVMHQNTFHASIVLCPLLMHKPFPPHSCFAIPFHHSTHQPPLLFSFSLSPFHSLSQHSCHAIIQHSFTPSMCSL